VSLLEETIAAHGGGERFEAIEELDVSLRCGGIALATRGHPRALSSLEARARTREPHVRFLDWPGPGETGTFDGWDSRIEGRGPVRSRSGRRRRLRWDSLDVLHFAGYALWNYMSLPFLLARPGFETRELPGRRLEALFPPEIPTHSRRQVFHLDSEGRIARHDYTAEVFGRWARAAHHSLEYERHEGLVIAVRRRVVPRGPRDVAVPGPTLVSIAIDRVEAAFSSPPNGAGAQ
jgi:hypothetical protein